MTERRERRLCSYLLCVISYIYLILYQHKSLFLFFLCFFSPCDIRVLSHRPSSDPTQMLAPIPEGAFWTPASTSSFGEGSGTYSRHRTAAPTCRLFTALGMGLFRENISICPWDPSPPPATCGERKKKKNMVEKGRDPMLSCTGGLNHNARGNKLFCWNRKKKREIGRAESRTGSVSLKSCLQCVHCLNQTAGRKIMCLWLNILFLSAL